MNAGIIIVSLVSIALFFTWQWIHYRKKKSSESKEISSRQIGKDNLPSAGENIKVWWTNLSPSEQLELALALAEKAIPVWEKYTSAAEAYYQDAPTMPVVKIEKDLLQKTITILKNKPELLTPGADKKSIYHAYFSFVGPVLAMQDGNWSPPYAVKKIFSSVYHILKSIMEQGSAPMQGNYLQLSINQALDCLDISRLYTPEEITFFLESFRNKS